MSYRREETAYPAGWLFAQLADHFGASQVFKDIDSIELGDDFVDAITTAVASCDVLLALIGNQWLTVTDEHGRRRLDDPDDFVRLEIEAALTRDVRVIPILVEDARMPRADELPDSLDKLVRRQALELSPARFDFDTGRLLKVLDRTLAEVRTAAQGAASLPASAADPGTTEPPEAAGPRVGGERRPVTPAAARPPSDSGRPPGRQRRRLSMRARVLAGGGAGVVLIALIVAVAANSGTPASPGAATTSSPPVEVTTPPPTGAVTTTSPGTIETVLEDDFSSLQNGWEGDGSEASGAGYVNGAYRVSAPPKALGGGAGSVPLKAGRVYPSAPANIRIEVQGRRLRTSDQNMEFGVLCRINDIRAYVLTISDDYAKIAKWGARYKTLKEAQAPVDPSSPNRLQAVCSSVKGQQAVHLELRVNGRKVVETTDRQSPLPTGAVGLVVGTYQTERASVAEFDDFVVEQLA